MKSRQTPLHWICKCFVVLFLCKVAFLLGCSNETDSTEISGPEDKATETSVVITSRELHDATFQGLQHLFPPPILDAQFQTLHKISATGLYVDFLKNAYPDVKPFQNFKTFLEHIPPNAELYTPILKKHYGTATEEGIVVSHHLSQAFQKARILIYHGTDPLVASETVITPIVQKDPVFEWVLRRVRDEKVFEAFDTALQQLSWDIENENRAKIDKTLKERGRANGLLWLMLREPVVMGQVLQNFTDIEVFLKWLKGEFKAREIKF